MLFAWPIALLTLWRHGDRTLVEGTARVRVPPLLCPGGFSRAFMLGLGLRLESRPYYALEGSPGRPFVPRPGALIHHAPAAVTAQVW
jgi:hypothetical protein